MFAFFFGVHDTVARTSFGDRRYRLNRPMIYSNDRMTHTFACIVYRETMIAVASKNHLLYPESINIRYMPTKTYVQAHVQVYIYTFFD